MRGQWQAVQKLLIVLEASLAKRRLGWPVTESCRSGPDVLPKRPEEGRDGCRLLNGTSNDNCSDSVIGSLARFTIHPWLSTHRRYDRAPLSCRAYLIGPNPDSDQSGPRVSSYWPGRWTTSAAGRGRFVWIVVVSAIALQCRPQTERRRFLRASLHDTCSRAFSIHKILVTFAISGPLRLCLQHEL